MDGLKIKCLEEIDAMNSRELGAYGERLAAEYLTQRGYSIVQVNWTTRVGEVDLIAASGSLAVLVEVKTRRVHNVDEAMPELAVDGQKQHKYLTMAGIFLELHKSYEEVRFDVMGITIADALIRIHHIVNAFGEDGVL